MAYIRKVKAGWRAEVERRGVRDSITLPTKSAASQWATKREAEILAGAVAAWPRKTVADAHFHDARGTALTHMARRMDVLTLARISGHKDLSLILSTYFRESAEQVSARLAQPTASRR